MAAFEIFRYRSESGHEPFSGWLVSLSDKRVQARVRIRLRRLEAGLFGDCEPVGDGVFELKEHIGPGYRVYFGLGGKAIVILLSGGTKRTQANDIKSAKAFWADWRRRQA